MKAFPQHVLAVAAEIPCECMTRPDLEVVADLMRGDQHPEVAEPGRSALELFLRWPELGFVWVAREGERVIGCCVVGYAISLAHGCLMANVGPVRVRPGMDGESIGAALISSLKLHLRCLGIAQVDRR